MNQDSRNVPRYLRRLYAVLFSIYTSVLFVYTEASRPFAWPTRYLYFWRPHSVSIHRGDFLMFYLALFVAVAAGAFLCVQFAGYFPWGQILVNVAAALTAVVGLRVAYLFAQAALKPYLYFEFALASVCFLLWIFDKWVQSQLLSITLVCLHYGVWTSSNGAEGLVIRIGLSGLGIAYTLFWAHCYRRFAAGNRKPGVALTEQTHALGR
jgi:hypothetical protein